MWLDTPHNLILSEDEVHVWRADLEIDERTKTSLLTLLSPDEKNRAQKFRFAKDSRNFIAARGILRLLIGKYLAINPAEFSFQYSKFGKPGIANNNTLHFNISHSQNIALFAFSKRFNIGVDVEFVNPDIEVRDIARNFFSTNEIRKLLALPGNQQALGFFNCWTRKEAFIKAVGEGLSFPLDKFEVSLEPDKPAALLATDWDPEEVSKWSVYSLFPGANFVGCLVIEGFVEHVKLWNWRTD
ncbi:4'-phosphopantetheinyl transferase family protein [Flavitalea antarctica]